MGGIGSGRHWPNKKNLITDCKKLDVLELNRAGALKPGTIGSMSWSDDLDGIEKQLFLSVCFRPKADIRGSLQLLKFLCGKTV